VAVSTVRALLAARCQLELNRLQRELGGAGVATFAAVIFLLLAACTPPAIGAWAVGRDAALRLAAGGPHGGGAVLLGRLHALAWIAFALLGGLLGGEVRIPGGLRVFPLPAWRLYAAELATSVAAPVPVLTVACLLGLSAGVAAARPALALFALLLAAEGLLWMLVGQRWIAGLRRLFSQRLVWSAIALAAAAASWAALAERGQALSVARAAGRGLALLLDLVPTSAGWRGLAAFADGRAWAGALAQLAALATTALLLLAAVWTRRFEPLSEDAGRSRRRREPRLWSFRRPAGGVARLLVIGVTHSRAGRTLLLMPAFLAACSAVVTTTVLSANEKLPPLIGGHLLDLLQLPWAGLLPPLVVVLSSDLWLNQFGWDGPGVKTLLGLPISPRELLLGKMLGLAGLTLLQLSLLAPALAAAAWRTPLDLVWGLAAGVFALVALGALGHLVSAGLPRPADQGATAQGLTVMILGGFANLSVVAALLVGHRLSRLVGPLGPPVGLSLLAAAAVFAYWRALDFLGRRVMAQRDQLVGQLG
jgi:hypothetical protein